jgi:hypothetical protein
MQGQTAEIRPKTFAAQHLDPLDRTPFLRRVEDAGLDPARPIPKDLSRVKVSGFKMTFDSGMVLVGNMAALEEKVVLPDAKNPNKPVELHDSVKRIISGR